MEQFGWIDLVRLPIHLDGYSVDKFIRTHPHTFDFLFTFMGVKDYTKDKRVRLETLGGQKILWVNPEIHKRNKSPAIGIKPSFRTQYTVTQTPDPPMK